MPAMTDRSRRGVVMEQAIEMLHDITPHQTILNFVDHGDYVVIFTADDVCRIMPTGVSWESDNV